MYQDGEIQFVNHAEGYTAPVVNTNKGTTTYTGYNYVFQYKDHLGNVRLSYGDTNNDRSISASEIVEESNYYPFGLKQKGYNEDISANGNSLAQQWKFGGKQYQEELGLDWYDISARNYDPAIGRWMNIDPLAEQGRRWSPYNYAMDNPVYFMDPDGMWPTPGWFKKYVKSAWRSTGNLVKGAVTSTYTNIRNGVNATGNVIDAYKKDGVSGAAKQYVQSVYETSGVKSAVQTAEKAASGDPEALATTVVNVGAAVVTRSIAKGTGSSSSRAASGQLVAETEAVSGQIIAEGRAPATVVGAEVNGSTAIATSGQIPKTIAPALQTAAEKAGGVGSKNGTTTVGCCGEFRAANKVLLENPKATPSQVNFTPAIRPRTGEIVTPCLACKQVFDID